MDFASALLFVLGSVFYVELACVGYLYARDMRYVPTYVLTADDDAAWISYKLEERYNASSVSSSTGGTAVEEEPVRALATEGDDSAVAEGDDSVAVAGDDTVVAGDDTVAGDDAVGSALVAEGDDSVGYNDSVGYDDSFVSHDDDYVFQVGSSEVWVSQYQIIYFVAAFCFATAGLLDLIADRRLYHLFRFFGGVFGVASACTIGTQALASRITSAVSVHMFLMDAIAMLWIYKFGGTSLVVGKLMNVILAVGALSYLGGTLIDVVVSLAMFIIFENQHPFPLSLPCTYADIESPLASVAFDRSQISYLWIFDDTIDWNMKTAMAGIIAAALWLTCSLCYIGYFFYDFCGAHNTNARSEESEYDESVPRKPGNVDLDSLERTEGNID